MAATAATPSATALAANMQNVTHTGDQTGAWVEDGGPRDIDGVGARGGGVVRR